MSSVDGSDGWQLVQDGPYAGWLTWPADPFECLCGPFYFRAGADGRAHGVFIPEGKHLNGSGVTHGGALLTFADTMAGSILQLSLDGQLGVTVTLNTEFVSPGRPDEPIEATGHVVRETGSLVFVQGLLGQDGQPVLTFSSVLKKVDPTNVERPIGRSDHP